MDIEKLIDHPEPALHPSLTTQTDAPLVPSIQEGPQALSKNARKKLARLAHIADTKKERRAAEKERKKAKKAEKRAAEELEGIEGENGEGPRKKVKTEQQVKGKGKPFAARLLVDLGFDHLMTDAEIKSLTSQLAYTYSANRHASYPFASLLFTALNGRTRTRLDTVGGGAYKRWQSTVWWETGYEMLWTGREEKEDEDTRDDGTKGHVKQTETVTEDGNGAATEDVKEKDGLSLARDPEQATQESVVYLTADSNEELTELKEGETYIIGGICDHNRYKNLCYKKAQDSNIRSARLPIGTYLAELKTRKVLTVNQTVEILLKWIETRDWKEAFEVVIPKRKFNSKGKDEQKSDHSEKGDGKEVNQAESADILEAKDEIEHEEGPVVLDASVLEDDDALASAVDTESSRRRVDEMVGTANQSTPDATGKVDVVMDNDVHAEAPP